MRFMKPFVRAALPAAVAVLSYAAQEGGLTLEKALRVPAPVVGECPIVYECRVVHSSDVLPPQLAPEIRASAYAEGDYHRVYWGEIVAARAERDAARLLRG